MTTFTRSKLAGTAIVCLVFAALLLQRVNAVEVTSQQAMLVKTSNTETAVFAGGCFWCVESAFQELDGVVEAVSGFTGGSLENPTYSGDHQGHYEAVKVRYDPSKINYQQLLDVFWLNIDPFDGKGQFCDKGPSYLSAIFAENIEQQQMAERSKQAVAKRFAALSVVTPILDTSRFYPVVESHQDYYKKNPIRYRFYRRGCGRDKRLQEIWGKQAKH